MQLIPKLVIIVYFIPSASCNSNANQTFSAEEPPPTPAFAHSSPSRPDFAQWRDCRQCFVHLPGGIGGDANSLAAVTLQRIMAATAAWWSCRAACNSNSTSALSAEKSALQESAEAVRVDCEKETSSVTLELLKLGIPPALEHSERLFCNCDWMASTSFDRNSNPNLFLAESSTSAFFFAAHICDLEASLSCNLRKLWLIIIASSRSWVPGALIGE